MNFNIETQIGALFKVVVCKADTHEISQETGWFFNHVLDSGLIRMVNAEWIDRCVVGSGNSTPIDGQTALDSFVASTDVTAIGLSDMGGIQVAAAPYYWWGRRTWRFAVGTATGNLSEVGLGWGNANLWNRALIKDVNGSPTTITVLADEYVDVVSEVRVYPQDNISGSFNVVDKFGATVSTHTYTARCLMATIGSQVGGGWITSKVTFNVPFSDNFLIGSDSMSNDVTNIIPATNITSFSVGEISGNGVATLKATAVITSSQGNFSHKSYQAGISGLMCWHAGTESFRSHCGYKWEIDPPINKTNDMILTYSYTLTIGRYTP